MKQKHAFLPLLLLVLFLAVAGLSYGLLSRYYQPDPRTGQAGQTATAPDFTVQDADGNELTLSDAFGKPIVLNFWATWCDPCKAELPAFEKAWQQYGDEVTFLMVNVTDGFRETAGGVAAFLEESGYTFPVYYDPTLTASTVYGATRSLPITVLLHADGTIAATLRGSLSEEVLFSQLEALLAA